MVPSSGLAVVFFVLLIAPGLLFDLLAERRRATAAESAFREASRVVLASLVFTLAGFVVIALLRIAKPSWMPDPRLLFAHPHEYLVAQYRLLFRALLIEVLVALGLSYAVHRLLARGDGAGLRPVSLWRKAVREDCPSGYAPYARVRLTNGTVFLGAVAHYTADLELGDREIALSPPLFSNTAGQPLTEMPVEWQRVVLAGTQVESVTLQYRRKATPPAP